MQRWSFKAWVTGVVAAAACMCLVGCASEPLAGDRLERRGDEIMIAGQLFHTGTRVVLWTDAGGYDAYRVDRRFAPMDRAEWEATQAEWAAKKDGRVVMPNRYGMRQNGLSQNDKERVRGGGWTLEELQGHIDQFVLHYDVCGTSRQCFNILHDHRGLSIHFMIDLDGTIYQTLDLKERARHATTSNDRSVGVEIANMGAYPVGKSAPLDEWYVKDGSGRAVIRVPDRLASGGPKPGIELRPARDEPVVGVVQGLTLVQYDLTPEQYASLAKLSAALHVALPKIRAAFPRGADGSVVNKQLDPEGLAGFTGILGHYHVQDDKQDPGPAFDWDRLGREMEAELKKRSSR